ncbi:MAG: hypothetical protein IRY83_04850 [Chloroflexi bacterium]|nr:hypothetical protein [Chloroflexota bacterium]
MRSGGSERRARIVAHHGWLELVAEDGAVLRTVIYEPGVPASESRARAWLIREAMALRYRLEDEANHLIIAARDPPRGRSAGHRS